MIPKILHYCWFGGKKKPRLAQKCMESWRRFAPDFLLVEWNEQNFAIESVPFVRQAYEDKKYAYVSDYVRGHALAGQGGVYLDTDMELLRPLDAFLRDDLFAGVEPGNFVACGIIGSAAGHPLWAEYLARYRQSTYDRAHPVTNVPLFTALLENRGLRREDCPQRLAQNIAIYPSPVFYPFDYRTGAVCVREESAALHHYAGSFLPWHRRIRPHAKRWLRALFLQ